MTAKLMLLLLQIVFLLVLMPPSYCWIHKAKHVKRGDGCTECEEAIDHASNNTNTALYKAWDCTDERCASADEKVKAGCHRHTQSAFYKMTTAFDHGFSALNICSNLCGSFDSSSYSKYYKEDNKSVKIALLDQQAAPLSEKAQQVNGSQQQQPNCPKLQRATLSGGQSGACEVCEEQMNASRNYMEGVLKYCRDRLTKSCKQMDVAVFPECLDADLQTSNKMNQIFDNEFDVISICQPVCTTKY